MLTIVVVVLIFSLLDLFSVFPVRALLNEATYCDNLLIILSTSDGLSEISIFISLYSHWQLLIIVSKSKCVQLTFL